ncbi:Carboxypeptidase [Gryllus bimaculatus]|nr:Carboxypeptidase [Gryllus bimaculatus]
MCAMYRESIFPQFTLLLKLKTHGYRLLETQELNAAQARALVAADKGWDFWQEPRDRARAVIFASPEEAPAVESAFQRLGLQFHEKQWTPPRPHDGNPMRRGRTGVMDIDFNTFYRLDENYAANSALVDEVDWYILPVINPDGYEYTFTDARFWRKTRSQTPNTTCIGTDANRNFNFQWDLNTGGVCSETFAGVAPLSEPEAAALAAYLLERNDSIQLYLTLHSYGELLLTPWGYTNDMPEDADDLVGLANKAAAAVAAVRGTNYTVDYSYGTSRDWAKGVAGIKYSYTMELPAGGSGFDPPPEDIAPVVTETFEAIKVFAEAVAASGRS